MIQRICLAPNCGRPFTARGRETRCPKHLTAHNRERWQRHGHKIPERIRQAVLKRDQRVCRYCGSEARSVDHITPRSKGGTDDPFNLVAACGSCNSGKRDRSAQDFMKRN